MMQATTTIPLFAATLRPDRSLGAAGGWVALTLAAIVGAPFLIAIPQFLLPGLAAFGLAGGGLVAFSIRRARRGRQYQQVTLWPDQLEVTDVTPGQERRLRRFEPKKVRLRLQRDGFERTIGIFLRHDEGELELGRFLSRDDKTGFARAFRTALRQARRGV
ncbi:DUF2244 domain-containing protein [Devosia sp. YIM 151766]|uniref:DUF2244 domain-containing protein n=1 Tax=Devosia sp. YIM 151766 TaxID=3017325 RepID=UPI00255CE0C4|nr:DUF2244 domain-containing protein [Devosia sp. YIM 151766]WIY52851.1 DUF2244 domain-containing protein [Devosia sp. YIM 151766]